MGSACLTTGGRLNNFEVYVQQKTGGRVGKVVLLAAKVEVVALFVKIALIAQVGGNTAGADGQTGEPTPGHVFEFFVVVFEVGQLRIAVQEVVADRAAVEADRPGGKTKQNRDVQVLVFFFKNFGRSAFFNDVIGAVGVEEQFRLQKNLAANAQIATELGAKFCVFHAKIKGAVQIVDKNILGVLELGVHTTFEAKRKHVCLRGGGETKQQQFK